MLGAIRKAIITVLVAVIIFCGYNIVKISVAYEKGDSFYSEAREEFKQEELTTEKEKEDEISASAGDMTEIPLEKIIDFEKLKNANEDIEGWIKIDDTNIDYPVLKSKNSNDDYIYTAYDGSYSGFGSIFVDYRNNSDFENENTILYAHNMQNGAMFGNLTKYRNNDFANSHKIIRILEADGEKKYEVYSAYNTIINSESYDFSFESKGDFADFVSASIKNSVIDTGVTADENDKIITLSTCTDTGESINRFVVHARLMDK